MKVAIYGQYYKNEDKPYVKELLSKLQQNNIEFVIEHNYYLSLKEAISIKNSNTFKSLVAMVLF